jgi:outer membrane lipoprotein SlyB
VSRLLLALTLAATFFLAGCQADDATLGGTVLAVTEAEHADDLVRRDLEQSAKTYDDPLVPEVAWKVDVRLDNGQEVSVIQNGSKRPEPGQRVRLLIDSDGELLL